LPDIALPVFLAIPFPQNEKCVNYMATITAMKKDYLRGAGLLHRYSGAAMRWR